MKKMPYPISEQKIVFHLAVIWISALTCLQLVIAQFRAIQESDHNFEAKKTHQLPPKSMLFNIF